MRKLFIGLDISTTFSGITTYSKAKGYSYYAIAQMPQKPKTKEINFGRIQHSLINYHYYENLNNTDEALDNFLKILSNLWSNITKGFKKENIFIGIENFAFSAKGNNNIKLYAFALGVRKFLYDRGHTYTQHGINSIKRFFSGTGHATKAKMIKTFIDKEKRLKLSGYELNPSGEYVKFNSNRYKLDDISDSRAICEMEVAVDNGEYKIPIKKKKTTKRKKRLKSNIDDLALSLMMDEHELIF